MDNAVNVLKTAFTVVGGLMFAYGEGQSKKTLAGIAFGVGMAIGAVNLPFPRRQLMRLQNGR